MSITAGAAVRDPLADPLLMRQNAAGLERFIQAGGRPISCVALAGELQRDWARAETVDGLRQIVLTERLLQE